MSKLPKEFSIGLNQKSSAEKLELFKDNTLVYDYYFPLLRPLEFPKPISLQRGNYLLKSKFYSYDLVITGTFLINSDPKVNQKNKYVVSTFKDLATEKSYLEYKQTGKINCLNYDSFKAEQFRCRNAYAAYHAFNAPELAKLTSYNYESLRLFFESYLEQFPDIGIFLTDYDHQKNILRLNRKVLDFCYTSARMGHSWHVPHGQEATLNDRFNHDYILVNVGQENLHQKTLW